MLIGYEPPLLVRWYPHSSPSFVAEPGIVGFLYARSKYTSCSTLQQRDRPSRWFYGVFGRSPCSA
ncbi:hypothetical protein [Leptolyngbya sp. O-77]|uniref:hypothetical protein n=1 Tax=Leptolyngbya sp. O-77 TaxID=1080068 RepID=UPI0012E3AA9E|nr:hypothetical protein [Leptolyngbya sp. O-77]